MSGGSHVGKFAACHSIRIADGCNSVYRSAVSDRESSDAAEQQHLLLKLVVPGELCSCIDSEASGQATSAVIRLVHRQRGSAVELVFSI